MLTTAKWLGVVAATMVAIGGAQDTGTKPTPPPVPPPLHLPAASLVPEASLAIGGERSIAVTADGVWVSSRAAGTITRVDPKTNALGTPIAMGKEPCYSVLSAFGSLWTPLCGTPGLARIEVPGSEKAPPTVISTGIQGAGPVVTGTGSIWMITNPAGTLSRIDPGPNTVVAEVTIPVGPSAMAFGEDAVWVTSAVKDTLTRVNGYTNVLTENIKVGRGPAAVAIGAGAAWVHNAGDGSVSRIDLKTNKVTATIRTGVTTRGAIAVGEGSVWLSAPGWPLTRIDPVTNTLAQQFTGPGGGALAIGHKSLWIAATPTEIWRVDPKRVEATRK